MGLNWNEIKSRALLFSKTWADACSEDSQAKPFWIDFFEIFGITNKRVVARALARSSDSCTIAKVIFIKHKTPAHENTGSLSMKSLLIEMREVAVTLVIATMALVAPAATISGATNWEYYAGKTPRGTDLCSLSASVSGTLNRPGTSRHL